MTVPRFRISWLMILVAFVAVDFAAIRFFSASHRDRNFRDLALVGALPTLNVLGICLLAARARAGSRPFLHGFVVFGTLGLLTYLLLSLVFTSTVHDLIGNLLRLVLDPFIRGRPGPEILVYPIASVFTVAPQLIVAWLGGNLSRLYQIQLVRRKPSLAGKKHFED